MSSSRHAGSGLKKLFCLIADVPGSLPSHCLNIRSATVFPLMASYITCAVISLRVTNHIAACEETPKETMHRKFSFLVYGEDDGKGKGGRGEREA